MDNNVVQMIEEYLRDNTTSFKNKVKIIDNPDIKKGLDELFNDKTEVSTSDIKHITKNQKVIDVIDYYLFSNGIKLVNADTYYKLGKRREDLDILHQYLLEIGKIDLLTFEEEKDLFAKYSKAATKEEKELYTNQIMRANLRLVVNVAKKYANRGLPLLDLIQEGNLGLMEAIKRFDVEKGYRFSTYATSWIKHHMGIAVANDSRTIRFPAHVHELLYNLYKVLGDYYDTNGSHLPINDETKPEIAKMLNVSESTLDNALKITRIISIEQPVFKNADGKDILLKDYIADESYSASELLEKEDEARTIRNMIDNSPLNDREKIVLKLRYGIGVEEPMMLKEIGAMFDISDERVRQIQRKSEEKFKKYVIRKGLR